MKGLSLNLFSLRNGFWMALALTVVVGSVFDLVALRQSDITDTTGKMVVLSYQVINETSRIAQDFDRLLDTYRKNEDPGPLTASLKTHFEKLQTLTSTNAEQIGEVQTLRGLLHFDELPTPTAFTEEQETLVRRSLTKIGEAEENILKTRLDSDSEQNRAARTQVLTASIVDVLLLAIIAIVWMLDSRQRKKTEETLSEAIQSISKANFELEQASLSKTHLLKATAHDLRNPLGSIQGLADLISEETTHPTVTELIGLIRQVSSQTLGLVNNLVDPKALATGKPAQHFNDFDMVKCLEDVWHSQQPLALKKNQTLQFSHTERALIMNGDSAKIWDLFVNLVGNAIKFSPMGSEVRIRAFKDEKNVIVEVEDQGPGLSEEDRNKAFQKYQRLSAQPTAGEASSGLGLYLVKEIVDAHNGKIEIQNAREGNGARFVVSLPIKLLPSRIGSNTSQTIGV